MPFDNFEVFRASSQRWHTYVTRVLYKKVLHFLHAFEGTGCVFSRGRQAVLCHGNPLQPGKWRQATETCWGLI